MGARRALIAGDHQAGSRAVRPRHSRKLLASTMSATAPCQRAARRTKTFMQRRSALLPDSDVCTKLTSIKVRLMWCQHDRKTKIATQQTARRLLQLAEAE